MTPIWYPEPLPAEVAAAAVASDVAGQVEAASWGTDAWPNSWLTEDDRRVWR